MLSAVKRRTWIDRAAMGFALFGISAPVFWLGLMALYVVWKELWICTGGSGYVPISRRARRLVLGHMILPWIVLALLYMAIYARLTRNNLLETLGEDYIRTARAKGLSERKVILKHGLRASLTPIVTIFGLDVALLVGGAIITESVFNLQGLGWLAYQRRRDPGPADACSAWSSAPRPPSRVMNLVVDIVYAFLDPRVRYADERRCERLDAARRPQPDRPLPRPVTGSCRRSPTSRSRCAAARRSASSASPARARASRASRSWAC